MSTVVEDVRAAIEAGDETRVRDLLAGATDKQRREIRQVTGDVWTYAFGSPQECAQTLAQFGSATARQVASEWWRFAFGRMRISNELVYDVLAQRGSEFFATVVRNIVENDVQQAALLVRRALTEGLIDAPPDHAAYIRGLVLQVGDWQDGDSTYEAVKADPSFADEIWRFFEIDCSTELSNAAAYVINDRGVSTGKRETNRWLIALPRLAHDGILDRDRLLDASLDALLRDFRPSMVGWYAKLHETLAPTRDERCTRVDRYLALLASPVPSVMKAGLVALKAVDDTVAADDLARAAVGPLSHKQKNLAFEMLALLARAVEREPDRAGVLLGGAALALAHERPDVQERALALLERHSDKAPRDVLLAYADSASPVVRGRLEALTGIATPTIERIEERMEAPARTEVEELYPVESVDELIELAAAVLEGQGDGDDVERFLDGVSRLCAERPRGFERRVAGLAQRAGAGAEWGWLSGAGLVQAVVLAWTTRRRLPFFQLPDTMLGFFGRRALEVVARASKGNARPLLALPTHRGGRIDPEVLAERERRAGRLVNRPDAADRLQARVRALPVGDPIAYSFSAVGGRAHVDGELFVDLVPAGLPSGLGPLAETVARIGRSHRGSIWLDPVAWGAWDVLGARCCLCVVPAHPEISFAGAARLIVDRIDASPQLHPEVALELALDSRVRLDAVGWFAVSAGLMAKSPDLQLIATDALVRSIQDGRFDPDQAAEPLAWLLSNGFAKASRLQAPLRDAGRVSSNHATQMLRLVEAVLERITETPHGLQAPLEAVLEHAARTGLGVERAKARAALERIAGGVTRGSKLGRVTRSLLELQAA